MNKMRSKKIVDKAIYVESYNKGYVIEWPLRSNGKPIEVTFVELREAGLIERNGKQYYINQVCLYIEKKD